MRAAEFPERRFPPPWIVEEQDAYFIVRDHDGQQLVYIYFDDPRAAAKPLARDEARRIASKDQSGPLHCVRLANKTALFALIAVLQGATVIGKVHAVPRHWRLTARTRN